MGYKLRIFVLIFFSVFALIDLFGQPSADFEIIYRSQCSPGDIEFVNNSSNASTYEWTFGNGNSSESSVDTLSQLYRDAGQYTITLKAIDGVLEKELSKTITIYKSPKANFTTNMASGCIPMTINFTAAPVLGDATIVAYNWDFRNGTVNQTPNPTVEYKSVGEYTVLLRITDANGCFNFIDKENCLRTYPQPIADFTYSPQIACNVPALFSFTNRTNHSLSLNYDWNFGNTEVSNLENPTATYTGVGSYPVRIQVSNSFGCLATKQKDILVGEFVTSQFNLFNANGDILSDGDTICSGGIVMQNASNPSNVFYWTINGKSYGTDSIVNTLITAGGWNSIQLRPKPGIGCTDISEKRLYVKLIKADFDISDIYCDFPLTVNFTNKSTGADNYTWELAQSNSSTIENPSIILNNIYEAKDYINHWPVYSYSNKLIAKSTFGCIDTIVKPIEFIHPEAKLQADKVHGCIPLDILFKNKSKTDLGIISKTWLFDDGPNSNENLDSIEHTYYAGGDYKTQLIVENERHCIDTSEVLEINAGDKLDPIFEVSPSNICYNDSVTFINKTINSDLIDYWSYSSSANVYSECEKIPSPKLPVLSKTVGYHDVNLDVDYNGCISSKILPNALYIRGPIAGFTTLNECSAPTKISFTGDTNLVSSFLWDFGDGAAAAANINPIHNYAASGDYTVKLSSVNDTTLCTHEFERTVKIRQVEASLNIDTIACVGDLVLYDASNSQDYIDECFDEGFQWQLGEDAIPRKTYKTFAYNNFSEKGVYKIQLKVFDANGCVDSISQNVYVYQPEASFLVDTSTGCSPYITVNFFNTSKDSSISNAIWNFGDFTQSNEYDSVQHTYYSASDNSFKPTLTTFDTNGCSNGYSVDISIFKPDAGFSTIPKNICLGDSLIFNPNYLGADSSYWQFDTAMFIRQKSEHTFTKPGIFSISHKVFVGACSDSLTFKDYISVEEAVADIMASDTITECYPRTIELIHVNTGSEVSQAEWDFDFKGNKNKDNKDTVAFSYSYPRVFYPNLTVSTKNGCTATDTIKITVNGPYAEFSISDKRPCKLQEIFFNMDIEKDVYMQDWFFGDGSKDTLKSPTHKYEIIDTIFCSLYVTDANGCRPKDPIIDTVFIKQIKSDFSFPNNDTIFCVAETLFPENNSIGEVSYTWKVDNTAYSNNFEPLDMSFNSPNEYLISLEIIDDASCSDTSSRLVRVFQIPSVKAKANDSICRGLERVNLLVQTDSSSSISWEPNNFIDDVTAHSTTADIDETTQFKVFVVDTNACSNSDSALVYVHQYPEIKRFPEEDTTILVGEKLILQIATTHPSTIVWNTDKILEYIYADTLNIMPLVGTNYAVSIQDVCFYSEEEFVVNVREIYTIELPDVFTPNGDGVNDKIYVRGGGIKELIEFKVYNRFGNIVYNSDVLDEGWDGYYNGKLQNADVYNYFVRILNYMDEEEAKSGSFNLVH